MVWMRDGEELWSSKTTPRLEKTFQLVGAVTSIANISKLLPLEDFHMSIKAEKYNLMENPVLVFFLITSGHPQGTISKFKEQRHMFHTPVFTPHSQPCSWPISP